jgi:hypothetical protein
MSLAGSEFSPDTRRHRISAKRSMVFSRRLHDGAAPLFKMILATQNEPEVAKGRVL